MSEMKITRRQFVGGAAVAAAATAVPLVSNVSTAAATPANVFPGTLTPWVPLNAQTAARYGWEIYKGKHSGATAAGGGG